jgi:hypothetical protein
MIIFIPLKFKAVKMKTAVLWTVTSYRLYKWLPRFRRNMLPLSSERNVGDQLPNQVSLGVFKV